MKKSSSKKKKFFNKRNYTISSVVIILIIILSTIFSNGNGEQYFEVKKGVFKKETKVAGKVVAKDEAMLGFNKSGQISELNVKVGDVVEEGQVLARLDQSSAQASVALANSNLAYEDARLSELTRGSREEEIRIQESKVNEAQVNTSVARESLYRELINSYVVSDDAIRFKIDKAFDNNKGFGEIYVLFSDYDLRQDINDSRREMKYLLSSWKEYVDTLSVEKMTTEDIIKTKNYLDEVRKFADLASEGVSKFSSTSSVTQTDIDSYKTSVSLGRTTIQDQIITLTTKEETYLTAKQQLSQSEEQLSLLRAGASIEEIAAQQARVLAERARVADAQTLLSDSTIRAPFSGKIVQIDYEQGETVPANQLIMSIISDAGLEIESYIPEVFIGDVTEGDEASIVFDAYPNRIFNGVVGLVEPKETIRDGISTYKTTIDFDEDGANILLGMTTDITIVADERPNTIMVPLQSVMYEGSDAYVNLLRDGEIIKTNLRVGGVDSSGNQEVISGSIYPGDTLIYVK